MTKIEPRKSICFNFEKDEQKQNFFDKAKKSDIIYNHDSVFLHKILSVKNPLLDNILRQNKSQILNNSNSLKNKKDNKSKISLLNLDFNAIKSIKDKHISNLIVESNLSPQNLSSINLFSSPKIVVNKNKNLGNTNTKEKEGLNLNTTFFNGNNKKYSKIRNKIKKDHKKEKGRHTFNSESSLIPETELVSLYTKKNLRKPVVIKFINGLNSIPNSNTINNTIRNSFDANDKISLNSLNNEKKISFSLSQEIEKEKDNSKIERIKPEEKVKLYNHHKKAQASELYRRYKDLEKKSVEISKRKMKKNSSGKLPLPNFKKETNLLNLKKSLDNILKLKSQEKERKCKKRLVNKKLKNFHIIKKIEDKPNIFRSNQTEDEKNDFCIKKKQTPSFNYWQEQRIIYYNNNNTNDNNKTIGNSKSNILEKNKKRIHHKAIPSSKSQKIVKIEDETEVIKKYYDKKKIININLIGESRHENIYNINLNSLELYSNFNKSVSYNNNLKALNDKNSFIRQKYSKKNNSGNKTPQITKTFIEDYGIGERNDSYSKLSYNQSHSNLSTVSFENKIKVNKKNHSSHKRIPYNKRNLLITEEEMINEEIKNNLQILNAFETLDKFIKTKNKNILNETFKILFEFINVKTINYNTLQTNANQNSGIKYVKKIVSLGKGFSKEKILKSNGNISKEKLMRKNHFEVEKQKFILKKRKELGFFERYENCKDFIDNFRFHLIKYLFKDRIKK